MLTCLMLPNVILAQESPIWLIKQGEVHRTAEILKNIAKVNRTTAHAISYIDSLEMQLAKSENKRFKGGFYESLKNKLDVMMSDPQIVRSLVILSTVSSAQFCLFYAIATSIQDLGYKTLQADGIIMGITHGTGFLIVIPFLSTTPRKKALTVIQVSILIEASALLALGYLPQTRFNMQLQVFTASVLISFTLSALYSFTYLANAESFPAEIRGLCVGVILLIGKAVGSTSPYIVLATKRLGLHLLIGCSMPMIISVLMTLGLKETLQCQLSQ